MPAQLRQCLQQLPGWNFADLSETELHSLRLLLLQVPDDQLFESQQITEMWANMPYWAFAWAGGRALAQWLLANPQAVSGKRVLDVGCGSGIAGIAAARAGATVWGMDIDLLALQASQYNAALNGVDWRPWQGQDWSEIDLFLGSDLLYDPDCRPLLAELCRQIPAGLLAEPISASGYRQAAIGDAKVLATFASSTLPVIGDFDESVTIEIVAVADHP
ncbi:class I SAM-dependent methyltransferase [Oceanobacter mangrovi]|uniref:class I SAM-dependent methyltransferase n=1 Tax=Oceanobacter mangrovi TaxID=2862510 RepID=UPI001C8EBA07|nr:50S ribosomal protein L11 methyltransferase [Oceanobacter mangrovi]